jgi:hypothetical protein
MFEHICSVHYSFWWQSVKPNFHILLLILLYLMKLTTHSCTKKCNSKIHYLSHKDVNTSVFMQFIVFCNSSGSCHLDNLMYLFPQDHSFPGSTRIPEDDQMVDTHITLWTNFAHTGYVIYSCGFCRCEIQKHILTDWTFIDLIKIKYEYRYI